jgi:hypothetical protein
MYKGRLTEQLQALRVRMDGSLSGAARLSQIAYSTQKEQVNITDTQAASRNGIKTTFAGHPTVSSVEEEQDFVARLKVFSRSNAHGRIRRAPFLFTDMKPLNNALVKERMYSAKDCVSFFLKRNRRHCVGKSRKICQELEKGN